MTEIEVRKNNSMLIPAEQSLPVDILNRQPFVDQMMDLLETLSNAQSSCTFALNGGWGTGKTFVLNMLERQLRDYAAGTKYLVFHYNCWQYDYYEEPLIAIVVAMLSEIDRYEHLVKPEIRDNVKKVCIATKKILESIAVSFVKNKIGVDFAELVHIDLEDTFDAVLNIQNEIDDEVKRSHEYDNFYAFNNAMATARNGLSKLTERQSLIVIVDELDRCLPNYAIKILERLHHLFLGLDNTTVILSIDKSQLDNAITQIFGKQIDIGAYLKKFINFEVGLDIGTVKSGFSKKYENYIALFDQDLLTPSFSLDEYFSALFSNIDVRTQERIMERIYTIHNLLFHGEKKDYSFMCFEVMMAVLENYGPARGMPIRLDPQTFEPTMPDGTHPAFSNFLGENWKITAITQRHSDGAIEFHPPIGIFELIVWYSQYLYDERIQKFSLPRSFPHRARCESYIEDFKAAKRMLRIIQ